MPLRLFFIRKEKFVQNCRKKYFQELLLEKKIVIQLEMVVEIIDQNYC